MYRIENTHSAPQDTLHQQMYLSHCSINQLIDKYQLLYPNSIQHCFCQKLDIYLWRLKLHNNHLNDQHTAMSFEHYISVHLLLVLANSNLLYNYSYNLDYRAYRLDV